MKMNEYILTHSNGRNSVRFEAQDTEQAVDFANGYIEWLDLNVVQLGSGAKTKFNNDEHTRNLVEENGAENSHWELYLSKEDVR